jgi:O-acetyl-ADP-ribose deacetylase (regulator of RNase III)
MVIHAVGPVWQGGRYDEDRLLASAYRSALEIAVAREVDSIAFPSLATGCFGFPIDRAAPIALGTVMAFLKRGGPIQEVLFVLFTDDEYQAFSTALDRWERIQATRSGQAAGSR